MNRFLATTALVLLMGAAPALAQSPDTPSSPPQEPGMQAPMQPEAPSAIPSEPNMKAPDQSSEATPILPDQSANAPDKPSSRASVPERAEGRRHSRQHDHRPAGREQPG